MKERGILFSAPMVRAILEGRKTQTRRAVRELPGGRGGLVGDHVKWFERGQQDATRWCGHDGLGSLGWVTCPYGEPGDRLWVRETWRSSLSDERTIHFAASLSEYDRKEKGPWRPSIFMPRWVSRITLEIAEVRVQRLQEISEDDARAEGVASVRIDDERVGWVGADDPRTVLNMTARDAFVSLWDSINGTRRRREHVPLGEPGYGMPRTVLDEDAAWSSNPWVWVLAFRRVER